MEVRTHNLGEAPYSSGDSSYFGQVYPVYSPEPVIPKYITVAQCQWCFREYYLDPMNPTPPNYCGQGIGGACGASEFVVFKRLIEVVDVIHSDLQVEKTCQPIRGCITLPHITEEKIGILREAWVYRMGEWTAWRCS